MDVESITKIFTLISSLIAVSVIFLKACNELLLNIIKVKYENISGQKSLFSMTVTMIGLVLIALEIILIIIGVFSGKIKNDTFNTVKGMNFNDSLENIIFCVFIISLLSPLICIAQNAVDIIVIYRRKLENKKYKKIKKGNKIFMIISCSCSAILIAMSALFSGILFVSNSDVNDILSWAILFIMGVLLFIIVYNFISISNVINKDTKYRISIASYEVVCDLFLDIGEYYFIFIDGKETYIKISEVKKIEKVKEG